MISARLTVVRELFPIDVLSFKGKEFKRGMQIRITTIQQNVIVGEFIRLNRVNLVCIKTGNKIIAHQLEKIAEVTKKQNKGIKKKGQLQRIL